MIREESRRFGEGGRLAGVVTLPAGAPKGRVVLVTAGLTPKHGPFRLYAQLARRLAEDGLLVLRFDLGGIGESVRARGTVPIETRTEQEVRAAVDHLTQGAPGGPLLVGGLCSGAEDAFRYAAADPRVTGVFMLDPFAYRTRGWVWRDALIRAARRALALAGLLPTAQGEGASLVDYKYMPYEECLARLKALLARGVGLHFLYTGGARELFNHRSQFEAMFPGVDFRGLAAVDYFPQLRHTQVLEADRRLVIEAVARGAARMLRCRA